MYINSREERGLIFLGFSFLKIIVCCKTAPAEGFIFTKERSRWKTGRERRDLPKGKQGLQCLSTLPSPHTYLYLETVPHSRSRTRNQPQAPSSSDGKENRTKWSPVTHPPEAGVISWIKAPDSKVQLNCPNWITAAPGSPCQVGQWIVG